MKSSHWGSDFEDFSISFWSSLLSSPSKRGLVSCCFWSLLAAMFEAFREEKNAEVGVFKIFSVRLKEYFRTGGGLKSVWGALHFSVFLPIWAGAFR